MQEQPKQLSPTTPSVVHTMMDDLEQGWTAHQAPTGHTYYYNAATKTSTYKRPTRREPDAEVITQSLSTIKPSSFSEDTGLRNTAEKEFAQPITVDEVVPSLSSGAPQYTPGPAPYRPAKKVEDRPKHKLAIPGAKPWFEVVTKAGYFFYHNAVTKESVWSAPKEIIENVQNWDRNSAQVWGPDERMYEGRFGSLESEEHEDYREDSATEYDLANMAYESSEKADSIMEFDEDDIARQLEAMQDAGEDAPRADLSSFPEFTAEEKEDIFQRMLSDKNVDVYRTWDSQVDQLASDPRYLILDTTHSRKKVFHDYCTRKIKEILGQKTTQIREDPRIVFLRFIRQHAKAGQYFVDFKRKHRKDEAYKVYGNSDHDREKLFRSFQDHNKLAQAQKELDLVNLLRTTPQDYEQDVRYHVLEPLRADELLSAHRRDR